MTPGGGGDAADRSAAGVAAGGGGSLLARTARGAGWVVAWRVVTRVLGLASTLVLVRLLAPDEFGLVALATTFALTLDICLAFGVEDQIVRARDPGRDLYDTAFTLNLARAVLVGALVAALAAPGAAFFGDPRLEPVLWALAAHAATSGLANIGAVDFRRDLAFEREFVMMAVPRLLSVAVAVGGAVAWRSHWALVAAILAGRAGQVAMSYALHPYRPRLSLAAWRDLAGPSFWQWATTVASIARDRADTFAVGRLLGTREVGLYSLGVEIAVLPLTEIVSPVSRACMPGFAAGLRAEGDGAGPAGGGGVAGGGTTEAFLRISALMALVALPAGFGLSLVAGPVVALAFGPGWADAAPLVTILALAAVPSCLGAVAGAMLSAHAMLRTLLTITVIALAARVAALVALAPAHGLPGVALAAGATAAAEQVLLVAVAMRRLGLLATDLLATLWRPALAAACMTAALVATGLGWGPVPSSTAAAAVALAQGVALGVVAYASALAMLWAACGRPAASAEADLLALARRALGGAARRIVHARRRTPPWSRPRNRASSASPGEASSGG